MKFVHIADIHFDSPFINLADKENLGDLKRLEQRRVLKKVIEYIKNNNINCLFISGDFYEQKYIKKSTIEYINNLFKEIPETNIYISAGNHDPLIKNSYYNKFKWNKNVKIFSSKVEKVELEDADIYGFSFDDFYYKENIIDNINIENKNKINILIMHASLDSGVLEDKEYNPISKKELKEKNFDYVALGHIHKLDYNNEQNQRIVYPSSTISLGFDELGEHGMVVGEIEKEDLKLKFIPLSEINFKLHEIDITDILSKEDLLQNINELKFEENNLIEIILVGKRNFEINKYELNKLITNNQIIKIKDKTKMSYNLTKIANEYTLKGLFAKDMLDKLSNQDLTDDEKQIIEKAIEIGFEALE